MWDQLVHVGTLVGAGIGFLLGTLFGVVVDKAFQAWMSRPAVELEVGGFQDFERDQSGITYTVTNVGFDEIPDYRIVLRGTFGTISIFQSEETGPLLPDQSREHKCVLKVRGNPAPNLLAMLQSIKYEHKNFRRATLQLVMLKSDRILFESVPIGAILIDQLISRISNLDPVLTTDLNHSPRWNFKAWLRRRRESKLIKEFLARSRRADLTSDSTKSHNESP